MKSIISLTIRYTTQSYKKIHSNLSQHQKIPLQSTNNPKSTLNKNLPHKTFQYFMNSQISSKINQNQKQLDCNHCSRKLTHLECNGCNKMMNYFQIFNIQQNYQVNLQEINAKAKELQKQYHPDKYYNMLLGDKERIVRKQKKQQQETNNQIQEIKQFLKAKYQKYSSYINLAKSTLSDNLSRAIYLLKIKGIQIQDASQTINFDGHAKFMLQLFSIQQEIEQGDKQIILQLKEKLQRQQQFLKKQFNKEYTQNNLQKCKEYVVKYKYINKAIKNIQKKLGHVQ